MDHTASIFIKEKLYENGGSITIPLLDGKLCRIETCPDGCSFTSDKLNKYRVRYEYQVFDVIIDLLLNSPEYRARKGNAHGKEDKVGYGKCTADTVVGAISIQYNHKSMGESAYDPAFVLAAVLNWAGIAQNQRGYLQLSPCWRISK